MRGNGNGSSVIDLGVQLGYITEGLLILIRKLFPGVGNTGANHAVGSALVSPPNCIAQGMPVCFSSMIPSVIEHFSTLVIFFSHAF